MSMTKQEMFDKALNGIRAQGGPAVSPANRCQYRADATATDPARKCAAGHLIADEFYSPNFESAPAHFRVVTDAMISSGVDPANLRWAYEMQRTHDIVAMANRGFPVSRFFEKWETEMQEVAVQMGVVYLPANPSPPTA